MAKDLYIRFINYCKGTPLYKRVSELYRKGVSMLSNHKGIPKFFAHGLLHLIVLSILATMAIFMGLYLSESNIASFNQIIYTFEGDTLQNYRLNYLHFEKDMSRRPDNTYNENDIQLTYGYEKDSSIDVTKKIYPYRKSGGDSIDLVSKVRYFLRNDVEDTIKTSPKGKYIYVKKSKQYYKINMRSNHERYYYYLSTTNDSIHEFRQITNAMDHTIDWGKLNPFFSFWIGVVTDDSCKLNKESKIVIKFNDFRKVNASDGISQPLIVEKIIPEPTSMNLKEVVYEGKELENVLKQKGIYVSGVDPVKRDEVEQKNLKITVYLGTIIAFMLDIIVQLFLKWRRLKKTND